MGHLRKLTNQDDDFYPKIGPFLASRQVHKELGSPPWDDDGKLWYVWLEGNSVAGFAAVLPQSNKAHFCSDYVLPEHRSNGIHSALTKERINDFGHFECTVIAAPGAVDTYTRFNFEPTGKRGKYTMMRREPNE